MRKIGFAIAILIALSFAISAQTREPFRDLPDGFKVSRGIEANGDHSVFILFPDKYTEAQDQEILMKATYEALILAFTCDVFENCIPKLLSRPSADGDGNDVFFEVVGEHPMRLFLYKMTAESKTVGIVVINHRIE